MDTLREFIPSPKLTKNERALNSATYKEKERLNFMCASMYQSSYNGYASKAQARAWCKEMLAEYNRRLVHIEQTKAFLASVNGLVKVTTKTIQALRDAIRFVRKTTYDAEATQVLARTNNPMKSKKLGKRAAEGYLAWLSAQPVTTDPSQLPHMQRWLTLLNNDEVTWAAVTAVEKTGQKEDGYDLTVPGYETFMSAEGVILSNTMTFHVPSHPDTVKEVYEKLTPSKMLFHIKKPDSAMAQLKHEQILGSAAAFYRPAKKVWNFPDEQSALIAIEKGDVSLSDEIEIGDSPTQEIPTK